MASLQNQQIDQTYAGLIKTNDEAALGATEKVIQDGAGNNSTLSMGTASASFTGTLDLSGATVIGGGGAAGLESGSGADSMQSAASLTTNAASASGASTIALGDGATADGPNSIVMGKNANDNGAQDAVVIGNGANAQTNADDYSVVLGKNAQSTVGNGIAIGQDAQSDGINTIMIGNGAAGSFNTVGIGVSVSALSNESIAIGYDADTQTGSNNSIAIGVYSEVTAGNTNAIAIGQTASAQAAGAVALGKQVIAAKTDTVSVQALETQTPSTPTAGGIIMTDAGSTERRLNIDASGNLQIDSTPVGGGGGGAPGLLNTTRGLRLNTSTGDDEQWRLTYVPDTYATSALNIPDNQLKIVAMQMQEGMTIGDVAIYVTTAGSGTVDLVLYKSTVDADGNLTGGALEVNFGTVDVSTAGQKVITSVNHTLGSTQDDVYFIGVYNSSGAAFSMQAVNSTNLAGPVTHGSLFGATMYRGYTFSVGQTSLPSTINGINFSKSTDFPIFGVRN